MTLIQFMCVWFIMLIFVAFAISIAAALMDIYEGEYRKALYTSVVSVALILIVFVVMLVVF